MRMRSQISMRKRWARASRWKRRESVRPSVRHPLGAAPGSCWGGGTARSDGLAPGAFSDGIILTGGFGALQP